MSETRFGAKWRSRDGTANRAATTMADQCVASISNFAVGIVVARISGPAGLGAFALAYAVWILMTLIHRALITTPMAILGDLRGDQKQELIRRGFAADVMFGVLGACITAAVGAALLVVGQHSFGIGMLSVAPWVLALNLQDYWRQMGFLLGNPRKSLMNDLLFNAVQALAFGAVFLAGLHSVFAVVSAWGGAAAIAALYGLRQFSIRPTLRGGRSFLWSRWPTSRWLVSERVAGWGATQLYLIIAGALLGPGDFGGLKAAQSLVVGPALLVINAGGSFGLPEASRQLAERGWSGMARVSRLVTGAGVLASSVCAVVVLVAAPTLLRLLYGPEFIAYAPSARIFGISLVFAAFAVGPTLALTTTRRVRSLFVVMMVNLVLSVAAVCALTAVYGVTGAAVAGLLTNVVTLAIMFAMQSSLRRSVEREERPPLGHTLNGARGRLVTNTELLLVSPQPAREPTAWRPPNVSSEQPP
jgi:O-antigen/teichoic acid export membrane protein